MSDHMDPTIVAECEHVQYTHNGVVMAGEFSRPVVARCERCPVELPLRLVADQPIGNEKCDEVLTAHLKAAGWSCSDIGDVCPNCSASTDGSVDDPAA